MFTNKEELTAYLTDLEGRLTNLQETVDKLAPVEKAAADPETDPETDPLAEETPPAAEEVDELDSLLQD